MPTQLTFRTTIATTDDSGNTLSGTVTDVGTTNIGVSKAIPGGSTNQTTGITFAGANLQQINLTASANCTLKINSMSSPFATINLVAGEPYFWSASESYEANPLNVAVTEIYVTCTAAVLLQGKILAT